MLQLICIDLPAKSGLLKKISHKWATMDLRCLDKTQLPKLTKAIIFIPYVPGFASNPSDVLVDLNV